MRIAMRFGLGLVCVCGCLAIGCGPIIGGGGGSDDGTGDGGDGPETSFPMSTSGGSTSTTSTASTDPDSSSGSPDGSSTCATDCSDDDSNDGSDFIAECDAPGLALGHCSGGGDRCDLWLQDCPEGEKCQPWANDGGPDWGATRCSPIDPSAGQPGDACMVEGNAVSGVDTCALGSLCWDVDPETNEGTCVAMCTGSPDVPVCDEPQRTCVMTNDTYINVCLLACDPLVADECAAGEGCYAFPTSDGPPAFACAPTGNGMTVDERHPTHCEPGTLDVDPAELTSCAADADPCCAMVCDLGAPACDAGLTCTAFYDGPLPPGLDDTGVCLG